MRCADTLPSIKNVRGRSPRPICVMTCSRCCHGAIHLRQTMKAMQPNATQIRTMTNQVTAFLFSSKYLWQQSGCEDLSQSQTTSCVFSLGAVRCCVSFGVRGVLAPLSHPRRYYSRRRYPKPRTVSIASPALPSFSRSRRTCVSTVRVSITLS